ncbi:4Fe-4S binding protein [Methanobrevibacter gottschalkii DSM 11977]|uniref:4Fe-4S binding protein n=2 Tax=Methanobacteriaceae TaxID=2159 RepID=A0A3N5C165_9EURY|nr:ferredoxin [Methanobrevibacter sp. A27]RPF53112.1 4Fe-4S binding protein [Methanobrevibacter gottschalkii DSM 11977]
MINMDFKGFRYHKPLPNFYKTDNPLTPKREISDDLLLKLDNLAKKYNFTGISYSKLSDDFKKDFNIDFDNVIIFRFLMKNELIKMESSPEKSKLMDMEFQVYGIHIYEFADFLRENGFQADLLHPFDDDLSLKSIAMQSGDCIITRSNICLFKEGLHNGFFMIHTSIDNLPFKNENDMLWVKDFCSTCGVCIERCPNDAFDYEENLLRKFCTAHREGCSECILICPFFKRGYDKVKRRYDGMKK